jgi:hypothetical protein
MAKGLGFAWEVPRLASFCLLQRSFVVYVELSTISFSQIERALTRFLENRPPSFCQGDRLWRHPTGGPQLYSSVSR